MDCVVWLFGRGASVACNLRWIVPPEWQSEKRDIQVQRVLQAIRAAMNNPAVDTRPYKQLLKELGARTLPGWQHRFLTTNWDYLLQREVERLGLTVAPSWLPETHVFHLNGSVEEWPEAKEERPTPDGMPLRSEILLETDPPAKRAQTLETSNALQFIVWRQIFVVVGVSFECAMDQSFLAILRRVQDDLPIGNSYWFIVSPDEKARLDVCTRVQWAFPRAAIIPISATFEQWLDRRMPELSSVGVLAAVK